jgi:hypothetical protein
MGSLKRKMSRAKAKKTKKDLKKQINLFDELGDKCEACGTPYDKNSREDVTTWNVVVRETEKIVRLYCPECWGEANKIIKEIKNDFRIHKETGGKGTEPSQSQ